MGVTVEQLPSEIAQRFQIVGEIQSAAKFVAGHIHHSYIVTAEENGVARRYLLQRINTDVFPRPAAVMANIERVLAHLHAALECRATRDLERRVLTLIPARGGASHVVDDGGDTWRMYRFIDGTRTFLTPASPDQAYRAARAFGEFQALLADLPADQLLETIPRFHDTPHRYSALRAAIAADAHGRASDASAEINFCLVRESTAGTLIHLHAAGDIPERIVHNDTKISNVLFDEHSGDAICVVDLDTVMPGLSLFDFGDMVRSMGCPAAEDERDLARVEVSPVLFAALAGGYLGAAGAMLNAIERDHLVEAARIITLEQGVRFLTDDLCGDAYYQTHHPRHNLERARAQLKLVDSIERNADRLRAVLRA